jgi:hypothetical protein
MGCTPIHPGVVVAAVDCSEHGRSGRSSRRAGVGPGGRRSRRPAGPISQTPALRRSRPRLLVILLAAASVVSGSATLLVPGLLTGPAVMNGSAKGTALVVVLGATPMLLTAERRARAGSLASSAVVAGASAYLLYNAVLLLFATPLNRAFPAYEVMLGLAICTVARTSSEVWSRAGSVSRPARRWTAVYILVVVVMNAAAWLRRLVPALAVNDSHSIVAGTGLTTNPVYVQDLAFWLPAFAWVAAGMWKAHGPRTALGVSVLSYWVLESASVALDQWWGHHADPASSVASAAVVPLFLVVGLVTLWPLRRVIEAVETGSGDAGSAPVGVTRSIAAARG